MFLFFLDKYMRMGLLDCVGRICLILQESAKRFFSSNCIIVIPNSSVRWFQLLFSSSTLNIVSCLNFSHLLFLFSHWAVSDSLQPCGLQLARLPCPLPSPWVCSNSCPLSQWCHQPSHPLLPTSPLALNLSQHQGLFQLVDSLHQVPKVLKIQFFQWTFRITSEYIVISHCGCNLHFSDQWSFLYIFTHAYLPFLYLLWLSLQIFHSF